MDRLKFFRDQSLERLYKIKETYEELLRKEELDYVPEQTEYQKTMNIKAEVTHLPHMILHYTDGLEIVKNIIIEKEAIKDPIKMTTEEILQQCKVVGNNIKLPDVMLDYKGEYIPLKKKLEAIGGKWKGGKIEAFVFDDDPTELLSRLQQGEQVNLKQDFQFFSTPESLAMYMIGLSPISVTTPNIRVLEPSAGDGAIIKAIHQINPDLTVDAFELMEQNLNKLNKLIERSSEASKINLLGRDFIEAVNDSSMFDPIVGKYDLIIANPPFKNNQDIEHITAMFRCLKVGGALVTIASKSWTFGEQKKQVSFREWLSEIGAYTEEIEPGKFKDSGTMVGTMLIQITKQTHHRELDLYSAGSIKKMDTQDAIELSESQEIPESNELGDILDSIEEEIKESSGIIRELKQELKKGESITEMEFFKQLKELVGEAEVTLSVKAKNDKLTVMLSHKGAAIQPVIVTGTAEELDEGFFGAIPGVAKGLVVNANAGQQTAEKPKKKTTVKAESVKEDTEAKKAREEEERIAKEEAEKKAAEEQAKKEREDKYKSLINEAADLEAKNEFKRAAITVKSAKEFSDTPEEDDKRIKELMQKHLEAEMADI